MSLFSKNTKLNSDEYETLTKKIITLTGEVEALIKKFEVLTTNYNSLRGLINRKIGLKDLDQEQPQDINNAVILPDNGFPFKPR